MALGRFNIKKFIFTIIFTIIIVSMIITGYSYFGWITAVLILTILLLSCLLVLAIRQHSNKPQTIASAESRLRSDYTSNRWTATQVVPTKAKAVHTNTNATQAQIDLAVNSLKSAVDAPVGVDAQADVELQELKNITDEIKTIKEKQMEEHKDMQEELKALNVHITAMTKQLMEDHNQVIETLNSIINEIKQKNNRETETQGESLSLLGSSNRGNGKLLFLTFSYTSSDRLIESANKQRGSVKVKVETSNDNGTVLEVSPTPEAFDNICRGPFLAMFSTNIESLNPSTKTSAVTQCTLVREQDGRFRVAKKGAVR